MTKPMDKWCCLGCDKLGKFIHEGSARTPRAALRIRHLLPPHCKAPLLGSESRSHFRAQMLNLKGTNILFQQLQISQFFPQEQQSNNRARNTGRKKSRCSMLWKCILTLRESVIETELMENNGMRTDWSCTRKHHLGTGHRWGLIGLVREESQIWIRALIQNCIWGLPSETW